MENLLIGFKNYCVERRWFFDEYCSEFTIQFRLCRYFEDKYPHFSIELESSVERYDHKKLVKKEIDIDISEELSEVVSKTAIEIKFVRDHGSYNIGMYKYCEDIKFLEQLTSKNFLQGFAIIFTTISELYTKPRKELNPKNKENLHLYNCFRKDNEINGLIKIKTGPLNSELELEGTYKLDWFDFTDNIKACIIKVEKK